MRGRRRSSRLTAATAMNKNVELLALGSPRFRSAALEARARQEGPAAVWPELLSGDAAAALRDVDGDFAVAWRDGRGRTVLAVDRFAQRTLCWRLDGEQLRFAARADELAAEDEPLEPQALFDYLYFHCIPSPRTIYRDVFRLPPGHVLEAEGGRVTVRRYWTPTFQADPEPSFDEKKQRFRALLQDAVKQRLDGSTPACFLSGGTDSSTVAGMISQVAGAPAHTYSIGFEAEGYDELAFARIAARHFRTEHHEYYVTPADLVAGIGKVAGHYDQPFGNSSALPAYYCALRAREDGVTRMLAGDGGDELFGGNSRYAKQRVFGWYGAVPGPLRRALMEPLLLRSPLGGLPGLRKGRSYVEQAVVSMPERLQMYNLLLRLGTAEVFEADFLARVDTTGPGRHQHGAWQEAAATTELDRTLAFDWRYTLAESDLPKVCMTTQLAGVAVAFPFLDDELPKGWS
jgi:asparagine synthase (glutamine-hydrolysing)